MQHGQNINSINNQTRYLKTAVLLCLLKLHGYFLMLYLVFLDSPVLFSSLVLQSSKNQLTLKNMNKLNKELAKREKNHQ